MPNPYISKIRLPNGTVVDIRDESSTGMVRYGTTADWNSEPTLIPEAGSIVVYSDARTIERDEETVYVPGIKIGDGLAYLIDLPFCDDATVEMISSHAGDTGIHVTSEEKTLWNNKLNYTLTGENLIFNRL